MKTCPSAYHCPVEATIDIVGGKHKVLILWHLSNARVLRFGELQRRMTQATPKMLTQQLRELEADGMVHRELYHQVPPKTEYSLTERGPGAAQNRVLAHRARAELRPHPQPDVRLGKGRAGRRGRRDVRRPLRPRSRSRRASRGLTAPARRGMLGDAVSASTRRHA